MRGTAVWGNAGSLEQWVNMGCQARTPLARTHAHTSLKYAHTNAHLRTTAAAASLCATCGV